MSAAIPLEALKAQAMPAAVRSATIAARSYEERADIPSCKLFV